MGLVGPPMIQFVPLERESQDPGFQKEYLKFVDEESTSVTPDEIEKLVRELPRDTEIQSSCFSNESATAV